MLSSLILLSLIAPPAQAAVNSKCLKPFTEILEKAEREEWTKPRPPAECQYYQFKDLDESMQARVTQILKRDGQRPLSPGAKLSETITALALRPPPTPDPNPCSKFEGRFKQRMADLIEEIEKRGQCLDLLKKWADQYTTPEECAAFVKKALEMGRAKCSTKIP